MKTSRRGFLRGLSKAPLAIPALGMIKLPEVIDEDLDLKPGDIICMTSGCLGSEDLAVPLWEVSTVIKR